VAGRKGRGQGRGGREQGRVAATRQAGRGLSVKGRVGESAGRVKRDQVKGHSHGCV